MRHLAALVAALCVFAVSAWAQAAEPAAFRDAVIARVRAFEPGARIEARGPLSFTVDGDVEVAVNLTEAFADYGRRSAGHARLIDYYARAALAPLGGAATRQRIVLVLRTRAAAEELAMRERARDRRATILWRPFAGDLAEIVALESGGSVEFVTGERLASLGVGVQEAWSLAPANTAVRLRTPAAEPVEPGSSVLIARGENAASALLVREHCMEGGPATAIALVIGRGEVLFADLGQLGAEARFLAVARAVIADGLSSSQTPIACRNGVWEAQAL